MAPENVEDTPETDAGTGVGAEESRGSRRRFRPSQVTILVTVAALGLNLAALAIVITSIKTSNDQVVEQLRRRAASGTAEAEPGLAPTDIGRVNELMSIAEQLEQSGEVESARQVRAAAQRILVAKSEEDGAFEFACRLLENGNTREARRALYRIIARSDQPGTRWDELGTRARFLIGKTLSTEADGRELEQGDHR